MGACFRSLPPLPSPHARSALKPVRRCCGEVPAAVFALTATKVHTTSLRVEPALPCSRQFEAVPSSGFRPGA
eukprot:11509452-Alexandrium_andersonii.AAC.1